MSVRLTRFSSFAILIALYLLVSPARSRAQCPMGNCGSMMGHESDRKATQPAAAAAGAVAPNAASKAQAAEIWESRCATCHGAEGKGDGPAAAGLQPRPVNFHNLNWQKVVTDEQIAKAIVEGGGAVGLSDQMAANPDLEDEPAVVKALVAHVRELGKTQ